MQARYLAGDYAAAADALSKAQPPVDNTYDSRVWFYGALSYAALGIPRLLMKNSGISTL